ncbi:MAG: hypothetical protein NVSMB13_10470 [Mycobacteriales bacterium]
MATEADALARAVVDEAAKKSGVLWVVPHPAEDAAAPDRVGRPAWHLWHEGAAYVVVGGQEQQLPGLAEAGRATVTVRSKDNGGRLVSFSADVERLLPDDTRWATVAPLLHAKRLNASDGEAQLARWARESQIWRLAPDGRYPEQPGTLSTVSHAAAPVPSAAATRVPVPFTLAGWRRRRIGRS